MPVRIITFALLLVCAAAAADDFCGTSPENNARLAALHEWNTQRLRSDIRSHAATQVTYRDGVFVMNADEATVPNHRPLDLIGRTLTARRIDSERFEITNGPLQYREKGTLRKEISGTSTVSQYAEHAIAGFSFPFGTTQRNRLYISGFGAISFNAPPAPIKGQHSAVSAVMAPVPMIAPLMIGYSHTWGASEIYVREESSAVIVTWNWSSNTGDPVESRFNGEVQAVLHANGDIQFSYKSFVRFLGGAPVITTGAESFRTQRQAIIAGSDASGDVTGVAPPFPVEMFDVRSVELSRAGDVDLVEMRAEVGQAIDLTQIPGTNDLVMNVSVFIASPALGRSSVTSVSIRRSGAKAVKYQDGSESLYAATVSGTSIRILIPESYLPPAPYDITVTTNHWVDNVARTRDAAQLMNVSAGAPSRTMQRDLSAFSAATTIAMPVVEAFTVADLDPRAVWNALKASYGFTDQSIDAVVIYTSFPTDIDYYATAYSTVGNPGVDGIGFASTALYPREPAMMHMNIARSRGPMLHEFMHRWLWFLSVKDGASSVNLSDGTGHPRGNIDTTAAFTDGDSPLGGQRLTERGNGTFERSCGVAGASWLELYVMGLASADEVPPTLDLPNVGYVGCGTTFNAAKKAWTIQQLIAENGPRVPSYASSHKRFNTAFVLLEDPAITWPEAAAAVRSHAEFFEDQFRDATSGRGEIVQAHPQWPPKRRSAKH